MDAICVTPPVHTVKEQVLAQVYLPVLAKRLAFRMV